MSDYVRNKQVLYPVTKELLEKLNYDDVYDFEEKFPAGSKFTTTVKKYQKDKKLPVVDGKISAKANTWKKLLGL